MNDRATSIVTPRTFWIPLLCVVIATALFDLLFWRMAPGLNVPLFTIGTTLLLLLLQGWHGLSSAARWALGGALISAAMVFVHNSIVSIIAAFASLAVATALVKEERLRSLAFAGVQDFASFFLAPIMAIARLDRLVPQGGVPRQGWRWIKLGILPAALLLLFTQLYRGGNPRFDALTAGFMTAFFDMIGTMLERFFTAHTLFVLFGAAVCASLLIKLMPDTLVTIEQRFSDVLRRVRVKRPHWLEPLSMDPLERERRMGMILLVAVNVLLAVVNVIDINWVWFGFEVPKDFSLKQFVHEGTWLLIISILLSMVILMWLFRRNQNFYWRSKGLRMLAFVWIAQNFILGVSVFLRNYHYISFHGLAYKRVGVIVFLALVLVGLITLFVKVRDRKSLFYLARVNAWAVFLALIGLSTVDWDSLIVRYNLGHWNQGEIDVDNYLVMSDKVLPLLYANIDKVEAQMEQHKHNAVRWVDNLDIHSFRRALDVKRYRFEHRYDELSWQEWNLADRRTARSLAQLN